MPVPLLVLVFVSLIPYILAGVGGYVKISQLGHLDNHHPRLQALELTGSGARAVAAQSNAWEALAFYTATIFSVSASGVPWNDMTVASLIFGATRIAHPLLYLANIAAARSIVVVIGVVSCIYMMTLAF